MGGIWEINFSLSPRGGAGCQLPDGADGGACVRLVAAVGCQQFVEQGDGGVGADRRPNPQRLLPAGLKALTRVSRVARLRARPQGWLTRWPSFGHAVGLLGEDGSVTAQSAHEYDPDDPVEILRVLPGRFHEQFLAEYDAVVTAARRPERYHELHHLLRLWRLRAAACSDPDSGLL